MRTFRLWDILLAASALLVLFFVDSMLGDLKAAEYSVTPQSNIQKVVEKLKPGDICRFAPGVYRSIVRVSVKGNSTEPHRHRGERCDVRRANHDQGRLGQTQERNL